MTTTAEIERALITALDTIRDNWAALVEPLLDASAPAGNEPVTGGKAALTSIEARVSLRYETIMCLNSWSRIVVEDRGLTHQLPLGHDAPGMLTLLHRHAAWLSGHEAAGDCSRELGAIASRVKDSAEGNRVAKIQVGRCPECVWTTPDEMGRCTGNLWAHIQHSDGMLPKAVVCDGAEAHSWAPHEWAALGRRVTLGAQSDCETMEDPRDACQRPGA